MKFSRELAHLFEIACRSESTVLLTGPTGSGKTSLAMEIHARSSRASKPFVTVNLASIHSGTIESELFGHERGAFTGANQKRVGKLELAHGGTVFLDEIGEIPPELQAKLLGFLQSKAICPVGSNREARLDVRVVAATHRDLFKAVRKGEFREDLFHRLRVIPLELKPLCERWDEFDEIIHRSIEDLCHLAGRKVFRISEAVAEELENYDWPGNLRELRNVLEFAVCSSLGDEILVSDLPPWFSRTHRGKPSSGEDQAGVELIAEDGAFRGSYADAMKIFEKEYLRRNLRKYRGRISHTAREIHMSKATLIRRMREYGLTADNVF